MSSKFIMPYDDGHEPDPWYIYDHLFYFSPGSPEDSRYPFGLVYEWHLFDSALDPHNPYVFLQRHIDYLTFYGGELVDQVYDEIIRGGYDISDAKEDFQMLLQPILNHISRYAEGTWVHRNDPMQYEQCLMGLGLFYTLSCRLDVNFDLIFDQYGIDLDTLHIPKYTLPPDLSDPDLNIVQAVLYFRRRRQAVLKWFNVLDAAEAFFREDWCYYYGFWLD